MNWKSVATGFIGALVITSFTIAILNGLWKEPASAEVDKTAHPFKYRAPLDTSREGLRKEMLWGLEKAVVMPR